MPTLGRGGCPHQRDWGGGSGVGEIHGKHSDIASGRGSHVGGTACTETRWRGRHGSHAERNACHGAVVLSSNLRNLCCCVYRCQPLCWALGDTGRMGSRRFTGLLMPPAGRTVLPAKAGIESNSEAVFPREGSSKRQEKPNRVKKEGKELNQKEPTLGRTVNKQEGTFLCHQPYFFGNKNYFSRNNLSIQPEKVLKRTASVQRKSPGVLTFLSKVYGQLSWALPNFPARELSSGGSLHLSAANVFPRACPKWTKN